MKRRIPTLNEFINEQILNEEGIVHLDRLDKNKPLQVGDVTKISRGKNKGKKVKIVDDLGGGKYKIEFVDEFDSFISESEDILTGKDILVINSKFRSINDGSDNMRPYLHSQFKRQTININDIDEDISKFGDRLNILQRRISKTKRPDDIRELEQLKYLIKQLEKEGKLNPIVLNKHMKIIDGFHRLNAYVIAGKKTIDAYIEQ